MNADQAEEIASLAAIYGEDAVTSSLPAPPPPRGGGPGAGGVATVNVALPVELEGHTRTVLVTCALPAGYPGDDELPAVEVEGLPRGLHGDIMRAAEGALAAHRGCGAPLLFPLIEAVRGRVVELGEAVRQMEAAAARAREEALAARAALAAARAGAPDPARARGITIVHSAPVVAMKSTFVAHLARVASRADCDAVVAELYQDGRVARATHNMRAHRFVDAASGALVCDNDDDGEDAAGGRLAALLDAMRADGVLVVVSRWYGGVLMGPARFKVINDVARALIEAQPWYAGRRK